MPSMRAPPLAASTSRCRRPAARPTASPPAPKPVRSPSSPGDGPVPWSADIGRWDIPLDQLIGDRFEVLPDVVRLRPDAERGVSLAKDERGQHRVLRYRKRDIGAAAAAGRNAGCLD